MLPNADVVMRLADVAAGWVLTYFVHSTVIVLAVWAIASRARVSDTVREILWKSALVGGILTATVQTAVTREPLGGQLRLAPRAGRQAAPMVRMSLREGQSGAPRFFVMRSEGARWTPTLVVLWLTAAGAGLLWLTFGHARMLHMLGTRSPLDGTPIDHRLRDLLARARIDRPVELSCSPRIASPVALLGDEVCLPRRALLELDAGEQESMLAHEVAHLVRRDPQWLVVARAIEMMFFFQPLNRLARHRMQEVAEYLCDDWAVARTSRPITLAKCLAAVAEWVGRAPRLDTPNLQPMSAMVESGGSPLVRRVGRILSGRGAPGRRTSRVAFVGSVCGLALLAGVAPRISIASAAGPRRGITFVRAVVEGDGMMARRDSMVIVQTGGRRIAIDSLARQRSRVAAGAVVGGEDVLYRRVTIQATAVDSIGDAVWTRRVPPPGNRGFTGAVITPLSDTVRAGVLMVERGGDR